MKKLLFLFMLALPVAATAGDRNFKKEQKKQEQVIKSAYKGKKITELEYEKLMREQEIIKHAIEKYEADGYLDSHEKNVLHDKLERAEKRLKRYKHNSERY